LVGGKKMSKSLGNFYTLQDIQKKKYHPLLLRLILLKTNYRKVLDFNLDDFIEAKAITERFLEFLINLDFVKNEKSNISNNNIKNQIKKNNKNFKTAMDDDLNISGGLASVFDFMGEINKIIDKISTKQAQEIKDYMLSIDSVLGIIELLYKDYVERLNKITKSPAIKKLLVRRDKARKEKNYSKSDKLRNDLLKKEIIIEDVGDEYRVKLRELV